MFFSIRTQISLVFVSSDVQELHNPGPPCIDIHIYIYFSVIRYLIAQFIYIYTYISIRIYNFAIYLINRVYTIVQFFDVKCYICNTITIQPKESNLQKKGGSNCLC